MESNLNRLLVPSQFDMNVGLRILPTDEHDVYVFDRRVGKMGRGRARTNRLSALGWDVIMDEILIGHSPVVTFRIPTVCTPPYFLFCNFLSL
jgi:hypothetical protein